MKNRKMKLETIEKLFAISISFTVFYWLILCVQLVFGLGRKCLKWINFDCFLFSILFIVDVVFFKFGVTGTVYNLNGDRWIAKNISEISIGDRWHIGTSEFIAIEPGQWRQTTAVQSTSTKQYRTNVIQSRSDARIHINHSTT